MQARRLLRGFAAALLLAAAGGGAAQPPLAGQYEAHRMEMGSQIELRADGHFTYALSYGALDEQGAGTWRRDGDAVVLTSDPPVVPPSFAVISRSSDPSVALRISVTDAAGRPVPQIDIMVRRASTEPDIDQTDDVGVRSERLGTYPITEVRVGVAIYDVWGDPIAVTPRDNVIAVRFVPNDLGKASFKGDRLRIGRDGLTLTRFGEDIDYERAPAR